MPRFVAALALLLVLTGCVVVNAGPESRAAPPPPRPPESRAITRVDINVPAQPPTPANPPSVAAAPPPAVAASGWVQTIVKLRDPAARADEPAVMQRLSSAAGVEVALVRQMSGNAWVVRLRTAPGPAYDAALQRLRASGLVEYVEPDGVERIQPR